MPQTANLEGSTTKPTTKYVDANQQYFDKEVTQKNKYVLIALDSGAHECIIHLMTSSKQGCNSKGSPHGKSIHREDTMAEISLEVFKQ